MCYTAAPAIPWYDLFMVGMHYICYVLLLVRIAGMFETKLSKMISLCVGFAVVLVIDLPYLVMHQYTILSALLASVAILYLATSKEKNGVRYWADRIVCLIFLILCLWLRKQVFFMALPIGFCILIYEVFGDVKEKKQWLKRIKQTGIFVGITLGLTTVSLVDDGLAYRSEEWKDFKVYNEARTDIYDYYGIPSYAASKEVYETLSLSYGDWIAIDHYDSGLVEELDAQKLLAIASEAKKQWEEPQQHYSVWRQVLYSLCGVIFQNEVQPIGLLLSVAYALIFLHYTYRRDAVGLLSVSGMLLFQAVFISYFIWQGRFPERVSYGLYFMQFVCIAGLMLKERQGAKTDSKPDKLCLSILLVISVGMLGICGLYRVRTVMTDKAELDDNIADWTYVNEILASKPENRYLLVTKSFVYSAEHMFDGASAESFNIQRLGSWIQNSPLEQHRNETLGITDEAKQLAQEEGFYIIQSSENDTDWLNTFYESNGYTVEAVVTDTIVTPAGKSFSIIEMQ